MKISGYTFVRNATLLGYPLKASIQSILPLVDEFVICYCQGDENDNTYNEISSIESDKIKLVEGIWDPERFKKNTLYAFLSDMAKKSCEGDWLFYLQCDEVIHERHLDEIKTACFQYLEEKHVEGFLFNYRHFWGDYDHCFTHHGWYPREVRIVRNDPKIHSWRDAQSFRRIEDFKATTEDYLRTDSTQKLNVIALPSYIHHYGWVRPPETMVNKQNRMRKSFDPNRPLLQEAAFDYGPLQRIPKFKGTHPQVMQPMIDQWNWKSSLQYKGARNRNRRKHRHELIKYRLRSWIELNLLGGRELGGFRNYNIIGRY